MQKTNIKNLTFIDIIFPSYNKSSIRSINLLKKAIIVLSFSLFTAVSAKIRILLPFTPVPITGQTLAVLITGTILGSRMGTLSILIYLLAGIAGIPLFSGKSAGMAYLLSPTGGYLIGFLIAAYVMGKLAERGSDQSIISCIPMMLLGELIIYTFGLLWLVHFVPMDKLLMTGLIPFIPGDLIKLALASVIMPLGWRFCK